MSEELLTLSQTILKVQEEVGRIRRDATNPHFQSRYISLEKLVEHVQPVLGKYGLVWIALPSTQDGQPVLRYCLTHTATGEAIGDAMPLLLDRNNAQGLGSAITYARRYALCAVLNIVADEDDDGNAASSQASAKADFAAEIRGTGMKAAELKLWLAAEGGKDGAELDKLTGAKFAAYLNKLTKAEQEKLLAWAKGDA